MEELTSPEARETFNQDHASYYDPLDSVPNAYAPNTHTHTPLSLSLKWEPILNIPILLLAIRCHRGVVLNTKVTWIPTPKGDPLQKPDSTTAQW